MNSDLSAQGLSQAGYQDRISEQAFGALVHVRGEGDEWDFKEALGDLRNTSTA